MVLVIGGKITAKQKRFVINQIKPITKEEALEDFEKLKNNDPKNIKARVGNEFVDYFTFPERLETTSAHKKTFWDIWDSRAQLMKKQYVKTLLKYYKEPLNMYKFWYKVFSLYFGSINVFKPIVAMSIYRRFNPKSVLDFTMGWGGRLVGACALNIPKYTGIDLNKNLRQPYEDMVDTLKELSTTKIDLRFQNALTVDYSKIDYDMVLTSPPYYNTEVYRGQSAMDKEVWNKKFYEPIFSKTWKGMKKGHYCLNIPSHIYDEICVKILGKAHILIPLNIGKRNINDYKEYIYVWVKG
jgi:hypothetical protein